MIRLFTPKGNNSLGMRTFKLLMRENAYGYNRLFECRLHNNSFSLQSYNKKIKYPNFRAFFLQIEQNSIYFMLKIAAMLA